MARPSFLRAPGKHTGDCHRAAIEHFEHIAREHDLKWFDERPKFPWPEEVLVVSRPPTEFPLLLEKCFSQEVPSGPHHFEELRHSASIEVVENHDHIERTIREVLLKISDPPIDPELGLLGCFLRGLEPFAVGIHGEDFGPSGRSGDGVPACPTRHVQDSHTGTDKVSMPHEPCAGQLVIA